MKKLKINYLAVIVVVLVAQAIQMAWYTIFAQEWMNLNQLTMEDVNNNENITFYAVSIVGSFIMALALAMLYRRMRIESWKDGLAVGALIGFAFTFIPIMVNGFFEFRPMALAWLNGGVNIIVLTIAGLILGSWRKYRVIPT